MKRKFTSTFFLLLSISGCAQNRNHINTAAIDSKELLHYIKVLSSDSLEGRETGTSGQHKAATFIAHQFQQIGLAPVNNSYHQPFTLLQASWGDVYIRCKGKLLNNFDEMAFLGHLPQNKEIEKEVVFGGNGDEALLNQIDVEGKIVVLLVDNLRNNYSKLEVLRKKKAFAAFFTNPESDLQFESIKNSFHDHILQKRLLSEEIDTTNLFREFILPSRQVEQILNTSITKLKKGILENKIAHFPTAKVSIKCERIVKEVSTENVVGMITGKNSEQTIIVTAHYDHLGKTDQSYFPGADDNASGVAALLEIAQVLVESKPSNNILFMACTAEEEGLKGSHYYTEHPLFPLSGTLATVNMDMIGRRDQLHKQNDNYLYVLGADTSDGLQNINHEAAQLTLALTLDYAFNNAKDAMGYYHRSDQASFYAKGIPSLFFFGGNHNDYHKSTDTAKKIEIELLKLRAMHIAQVINLLANQIDPLVMKSDYLSKLKPR